VTSIEVAYRTCRLWEGVPGKDQDSNLCSTLLSKDILSLIEVDVYLG
jgi:hypothetical protein